MSSNRGKSALAAKMQATAMRRKSPRCKRTEPLVNVRRMSDAKAPKLGSGEIAGIRWTGV